MTSRRHEGDVLVLGYSLEAALAAAMAAKAGSKVLWLGGAPDATVSVGKHPLAAAPSLMPSLAHAPTLARVLREVGLLVDVQRLLTPVSLQFLADRRRISSAEDWLKAPGGPAGLEALQAGAATAGEVSSLPVGMGYFARRRFAAAQGAIQGKLTLPEGIVGEGARLLSEVFARREGHSATLQTLAAPGDLPGGTLALGQMLQRRCSELGARLFPDGLGKPLQELRLGWKGIEGRLFSGEGISARVALVALDAATAAQALPPGFPSLARFQAPEGTPLMRRSLVVRRRGLPAALGTMAIVHRERPFWLEARVLSLELAGVSLFWRPWLADRESEAEEARAALESVAPFHERHVVEQAEVAAVVDHDRASAFSRPALGRRLLAARGPLLGMDGPEGAAIAATALAARCLKLAPRPKVAA